MSDKPHTTLSAFDSDTAFEAELEAALRTSRGRRDTDKNSQTRANPQQSPALQEQETAKHSPKQPPKRQNPPQDGQQRMRDILTTALFPLSVLFMEILAKQHVFSSVVDNKFKYLLFFSTAVGFLLSAVAMSLSGRWRRLFTKIALGLTAALCSFHMSYHNNFKTFFSWQTLGQANDVTQFWKEALGAAFGVWYLILLFFLPFILVCIFGKWLTHDDDKRNPIALSVSGLTAVLFYSSMLTYFYNTPVTEEYSPYYYYTYIQNDLDQTFQYYGILNTTRLDVKQLIFGAPAEEDQLLELEYDDEPLSPSDMAPVVSESDNSESVAPAKDIEYGYNVMNIDFAAAEKNAPAKIVKQMDQYFSSQTGTKKNQYTGMFKDKNLIFISLEGFSYTIIDPEFTPMLYKMSTEGFVFSNFYNSLWGGSTATGEYANLTGNFYTTANCLEKSGSTYQPFAMGNSFARAGYETLAYHNNTYTYYGRDKSHPNFGYKWKAIGNGLTLPSYQWPNSDKEMAEVTMEDYVDKGQKFHAYYMSVSGHANYTAAGNAMVTRHLNELPEKYKKYPVEVRAYLACQYEVELMLQSIVKRLDEAGILEDTVIAMNADHYPYGLSDKSLAYLYKLNEKGIRNQSALYRNGFILWSACMKEPIVIDDPCSAIDIMPTLANLFGLEYDSRIIIGSDILSDTEHFALVKLHGWSWVSNQGEYSAYSKKFTPSDKCTLSKEETDEYVKRMNKIIKAKTTYSLQILNKDYYRHLFPNGVQ